MVDWNRFKELSIADRRKFLKNNNLQYKDVPKCSKCNHVFHQCVCNNVEYQQKIERIHKLLDMSHVEKINYSKLLIEKILEEHRVKKIYLAYSGGIDSECCFQLFKKAIDNGQVKVIWADTLVEFPETRKRIEENNVSLVARPQRGTSFKTIVDRYGLPVYSRSSSNKEKRIATQRCCDLLKKKPMKQLLKDAEVLILGLRLDENQNRTKGIYSRGDYFYSKTHKRWHVYPIAFWTIEDVWKFQTEENFGYNDIYNKTNCGKKGFFKLKNGKLFQIRTGCWSCPQSFEYGYLEWLETYYPKFYKCLMENFGLKNHPKFIIYEQRKKIKKKPCGEQL